MTLTSDGRLDNPAFTAAFLRRAEGYGVRGKPRRVEPLRERESVGRIRMAAKAVIVEDGRILLNHCRDSSGEWYALPGGGQEQGETLAETLVRECREEIGTAVEVQRLLFVREIIVANHSFTYLEEAAHQVEHLFACQLPDGYRPHCGPGADAAQIGVRWMDRSALEGARVYPRRSRELIDPALWSEWPVYWGDLE